MRLVIKILVMLVVVSLYLPSAHASLTFQNEYEEIRDTFGVSSLGDADAFVNILDYNRTNNWNNTILPLQNEDARFRGIAQYCLPFPQIVKFNRVEVPPPAFGENATFAWLYRPDPTMVFDGHSDAWLRLPLNNLTLGNDDTHSIRLAIWKPYVDEYNLSLGMTIESTSLTAGPHGDTPGEKIYDDYVYTTRSLEDFGHSVGNLGTRYIHQDTREVRWNTTDEGNTTEYVKEYNFTYVRVTTPLYRGINYIFVLQLTTRGVDKPEYEVLWTLGDMNNDLLFQSHFHIVERGPLTVPFDFDVPMIITDLVSGPVYGIGNFDEGGELRINFYYHVDEDYDPTKTVTVVLPFYSLSGGTISVSLGISAFLTGSFTMGAAVDQEIQPGPNTLIFERAYPGVTINLRRVLVSVIVPADVARNISFLLTQTEGMEGNTIVRLRASPYTHYYRTNAVSIARLLVSTTTIDYVPLDFVRVVPDPADLEASKLYVDYAEQLKHFIQQGRVPAVDGDGRNMEIIITVTIIGLIVVGTIAYIAGAPITVPLTAAVIGLYWLFRENIKRGWQYLTDTLDIHLAPLGEFIWKIGQIIWDVVVFLANALSWLITHGIHFFALWIVISIYLMVVWTANGMCNAVVRARRRRGEEETINATVFDEEIQRTWDFFSRILSLNMGIGAFLFSLTLLIIKTITGV